MQFLTITIEGKCYDLHKDMPIPQKGSNVFIEGKTGVVDVINYHIEDGNLYMISIFAEQR